MFIFNEGQRVYLTAWDFNTCRMLEVIAYIVETNGGKVAPYRHVMATNRTYEPDAEPIRIYGQGYIKFSINGDQYYFQIDDNPFFEHYYTKLKIREDGKVPRGNQVYMAELPRNKWMYDCLFRVASDDEVREVAEIVFDELINAPYSKVEPEREVRRVRVPYVDIVTEHPIVYVDSEV